MKKKILACLMSAIVVCQLMVSPVYATTSVKTRLAGISCSASVAYSRTPAGDCNGIIASTTFAASGTLKTTATVCYKSGTKKYTKTSSNSVISGASSATAYNNDVGNVYGGKGTHSVKFSGYTWETSTKIGTTW